jgi:hypothetical protein
MNETMTNNRKPKPAGPKQRLLTLRQAETEYGPPYTSLRDLVLSGDLPAVRLGGTKRIWVRREDMDRLIERSAIQTV